MKKCCFCWDVRSGTIASAVFILVTRVVIIVLFSTVLGLRKKDLSDCTIRYEDFPYDYEIQKGNEDSPWYCQIEFSNTRLITSVAISSLHLIFSIILLIGVAQRKKALFWPWILLLGVEIVAGCGFVVVAFMMAGWIHAIPKIGTVMMGIGFQCYMLSCVAYYYKQLAGRGNSTVYNVVPLNNSNIPYEVTSATTPFYNTSGMYYSPPYTDHPPSYDNKLASFNITSLEDKPPAYDDVKTNENCKGN